MTKHFCDGCDAELGMRWFTCYALDLCQRCYVAERRREQEDDPHERAAARARDNDFADTGGKDWT